ncbi:ergothioneine biosynthesis protein EgtB [Asticcacaulis sp. 201]|uniref:ergothioneine biosynthesis protein EgtB n=1 Tax=Asticcacaulis sp. 201 TaxID=3028787 RepID=UPI002916F461|nr:ergothioneine biosynthesis protein EgtB [Asticcacaulis sp. 201]MDV6330394.1 ergothioneine biosynthesis protein EgtB [Asticcacaulis sp. 201]
MNTAPCQIPGQMRAAPQDSLLDLYVALRARTLDLVAPLSPEDMVVQSMPDASPAKWHLAHTTWFFETFLLNGQPHYRPFDPDYAFLFNSYYEALGPRQPRAQRGLLTRPPLDAIIAYRRHVDTHMQALLATDIDESTIDLLRLGLAHEEQHQELLLMDILHLFGQSPLRPAAAPDWPGDDGGRAGRFQLRPGGLVDIGHSGCGFAFDNETPRHKVWLQPFEISDRLVTNGDWLAFMADGGYARADLWLSDGWAHVQANGWQAPAYWHATSEGWREMTLRGSVPVAPDTPVTHVSFYEADAFARWSGARLPTEAEWEAAASDGALEQVDTVAWQWTASAYLPYPGFVPGSGAVGEYNGKFMSGQMVLRGGCAFTPAGHVRTSYRNFFRPEQRWMRSGVRLVRDLHAGVAATDRDDATFAADVVAGLSARQKSLSPKYFYDATGSELFEAICRTPEYYPTRTESALLADIAVELTATIPADAVLVEFGSGASDKTRRLLDAAPQITAYVPIDISDDALRQATLRLNRDYPDLAVTPVVGDFTTVVDLPHALRDRPLVGFFPGSTIGNFSVPEARQLLRNMRAMLGTDARLIIGADMVKDEATLVAAYNDAAGVTAEFNKNVLRRINTELGGTFDLNAFDHLAIWNAEYARMEMHLVSRVDQIVHAAGHTFAFKAGERLHTENSHKFTPQSFGALAAEAGFTIERVWVSAAPEFAVFSLKACLKA